MGLRKNDLKHMLYDIFEVDSFASKMGEDEDIVTVVSVQYQTQVTYVKTSKGCHRTK